jgi:hypothetical protein
MTFTRKWGLDRHVDNIHDGIYFLVQKVPEEIPKALPPSATLPEG